MKLRILSTARLSFPLASALAALFAAPSASAVSGTWTGISGNWTDAGTWVGGTIADGIGSTAIFSGVDIAADQTITLAADRTIGNITFTDSTTSSNNLTITGANLLTLDVASGAPVIDVTQSGRTLTINSVIAGTDGLQKNGTGALTLNGSAVNTFIGGLTVSRGTLTLDYTNLTTPTDLVAATNALQINNGALTITGQNLAAATTSQTFAGTTLGAGVNTVNIAKGALATSATLNLGALTVNSGSGTTISPTTAWLTTGVSTTEKVFLTAGGSVPTLPAGATTAFVNAGVFHRVAGNVTAGTIRLAAVNSSGQLLLKANAGNVANATTINDPTNTYQYGLAVSAQYSGSSSIYGLLLNATSSGLTLSVANSGTLTLNSVIQIKATESVTIAPGTGVSNVVIGAERNLVIAMDNAAGFGISAPIVNNGGGASAVTIVGTNPAAGPGTVTLSGANTYTGPTTITRGTLGVGNANALATTSSLTLGGTAAATLSNSGDVTGISIPGPITAANSGVTSTIAYGRTTAAQGSMTLSGGITGGAGNVTFTTAGSSGGNLQTIVLGGGGGSAGGYGGNTTISASTANANTLRAGIANALPTTTVLTFAQSAGSGSGRATTFDLFGNNQTLAGLSNTGLVPDDRNQRVTSTSAATLTINSTANHTFGGTTKDSASGSGSDGTITSAQITGAISLVKDGAGTFTLGGTLTNGATAQGNAFTGSTQIQGGILVLGQSTSIQNSAFDTTSVLGDANNGLRAGIGGTGVTALTLGGLTGGNNFATRFTTTTGGYTGLTALTLNPGSGVTNTYSADIGNGAGALNLTKTGAGTQILAAAQSYTGTTTGSVGTLIASSAAALPGYNVPGKVIFNGGTIGVQVGGSGWTTGEVDTLLANATKTSGAFGIDTTNGNFTQWTPFTPTNLGVLGLNKLGANNLTLDQANTYTGLTTVIAGTLTLSNALALQNSSLVTTGAGTVVLSGVTTLNLGALSGATGNLATLITGYTSVTAITLNTPAGVYVTYGGNIADGSAPTTLTKTGAGTQVLTGTNSYTGATQIDGGILVFGNKASKSAGSAVTAAAAGIIGLGVKAADAAFYSEIEVGDLFNTNTLAGFSLNAASGVAIDTTNAVTAFDQTVALTAARSLTKVGTGTLILSTLNSHASTTLSGGILRAGNNGALGSGTVTINNIGLQLQVSDGLTIANNITIDALAAGSGTGSQGLIQNTSTGNATLSGGTITINASPSAGGHFASVSTGTLTVADPITATVPVSIRAGTVIFSGGGSYSAAAVNQGTIRLGADNGFSTSATLTIGASNPANFDLAGKNQTMAGLVKSTNAATVGNSSTASDSLLTTTGTSIFGGVIQDVLGSGTKKVALTVNGGSLTLSGANTYTGNTVVTSGTLALADNAQLKFVLGAISGTNNSLSGPGTATLDGDFVIDTAAADALASGTWTIVDNSTLTETYTSTFSVVGFVDAGGNKWTKANGLTKKYTFDEATGVLTLGPAGSDYASWANDPLKGNIPGEPASGDFDNDGITNIVEYALGQNPRVSSQPAGVLAGNTITYTKGADAIANGDVSWVIETSQTLDAGSWTAAVTQPPADPALTVAYTFTPSTPVKNFARLKVTQLP